MFVRISEKDIPRTCSFYVCTTVRTKFICHVNWWQILFSRLPVDAFFCLFRLNAIKQMNERLYLYRQFSWLFLYFISFARHEPILPFYVFSPSFSVSWFCRLHGVHSTLTFDFNAHILSMLNLEDRVEQKKEEKIASFKQIACMFILRLLVWHCDVVDADTYAFIFISHLMTLPMFIQWFQSHFCVEHHSVVSECKKHCVVAHIY